MRVDKYKIDKDIRTNAYQYFFYIFNPAYSCLADLWAKELELKFNQKFRPIYIYPQNSIQCKNLDNYIIICPKADNLKKQYGFELRATINPMEANMNLENSIFFKKIVKILEKKQDQIFLIPYTTSNLFLKSKKIKVIGPNSRVATYFDKKSNIYPVFRKLEIKHCDFKVYKKLEDIFKEKHIKYPYYLTCDFCSGSGQSAIIYRDEDLQKFKKLITDYNMIGKFTRCDFIEGKRIAVETSAYVLPSGRTIILSYLDEISKGIGFVGNIYPSKIDSSNKKKISEATIKIGDYLFKSGFVGAFGCGFIHTKKNEIYLSDLNPRKQAFYIGDVLLSKSNLIRLDLDNYLNNQRIEVVDNFMVKYSQKPWIYYSIHTDSDFFSKKKIEQKLVNFSDLVISLKENKLFTVPYWGKNDIAYSRDFGFILGSAPSYENLLKKTIYEKDMVLKHNLVNLDKKIFGIRYGAILKVFFKIKKCF